MSTLSNLFPKTLGLFNRSSTTTLCLTRGVRVYIPQSHEPKPRMVRRTKNPINPRHQPLLVHPKFVPSKFRVAPSRHSDYDYKVSTVKKTSIMNYVGMKCF